MIFNYVFREQLTLTDFFLTIMKSQKQEQQIILSLRKVMFTENTLEKVLFKT